MTYIIGIDPGKTGALALLDEDGELLEVEDMPTLGKNVSAHLLADILRLWRFNYTATFTSVIEDVSSSPQMGVTSAFSFGRSKGVVEGAVAGAGFRIVYVTPAKWKRDMRLRKDKDAARDLATKRWPTFSPMFKLAKHDGRAEAALIGLWQVHHGE